MKKRWLLVVITVMVLMSSCNMPGQQKSWTQITSVTVTPPAGEKDFSLEVKYSYTWDRERGNAEISCIYTTPSGSSVLIGDRIYPEGLDKDRKAFSKVQTMAFTVKSTNGRPEPGIYTAFCETDHENSRVATTFTVIESAIPTPTLGTEPTFTPTPTLTPTSTPASIVGHIIFDYAKAQSPDQGQAIKLTSSQMCAFLRSPLLRMAR